MQTNPEPSPDPSSADSAVGLAFVAIVLVSLFVAGVLGVVATRQAGSAGDPGQEPEQTAVASASITALGRNLIASRTTKVPITHNIRQP